MKPVYLFLFLLLVVSPVRLIALEYQQGFDAYQNNDYALALSTWKELAEKNDANSQYSMGVMYTSGLGVKKNKKTAFNWMQKSADQGHVFALFNLGYMYEHGMGVAKDMPGAVRAYSLAAEQGDARAQTNLGRLTYLGQGTQRNLVVAYALFYAAGTQNVKSALTNQQLAYSAMSSEEQKRAEELSEDFYQRYVVKTRW